MNPYSTSTMALPLPSTQQGATRPFPPGPTRTSLVLLRLRRALEFLDARRRSNSEGRLQERILKQFEEVATELRISGWPKPPATGIPYWDNRCARPGQTETLAGTAPG